MLGVSYKIKHTAPIGPKIAVLEIYYREIKAYIYTKTVLEYVYQFYLY